MVSRRRIWVRRSVALVAVVAVVGGATGAAIAVLSADASDAKRDAGAISERGLTGDGWPWLAGNHDAPGANGRAWQRCAPECGPVLSTAEFFEAGKTAAGTSFRLSAPDGEVVWEDRSPVWQGQVRNMRLPTLDGQPTVGETVTPRRGRWSGGWPDDGSQIGVRACRTSKGAGCVAISASLVEGAGTRASVEIGSAYIGWYVGAIERRTSATVSAVPMVKTVPPRGTVVSRYPAPTPSATAAAGKLLGPVTGAAPAISGLSSPGAAPTHPAGPVRDCRGRRAVRRRDRRDDHDPTAFVPVRSEREQRGRRSGPLGVARRRTRRPIGDRAAVG